MSESDLEERLAAVERAVTDGETDLTDVSRQASLAADVERLDARIDSLESTVEELSAAVEAVRGYAGNVRAVNRDVERRASAALATAETLEDIIADLDEVSPGQYQVSNSGTGGDTTASDASGSGQNREPPGGDQRATQHRRTKPRDAAAADGGQQGAVTGRRHPTGATSALERSTASAERVPEPAVDGDPESGPAPRQPSKERRGAPSSESRTDDARSQTEQFIERVRDTL